MPIKEPIHNDFLTSDKTKKIEITRDEFKSDIERMKNHCELFLSQIMILGFKQFIEAEIDNENNIKPEFKEKYDGIKKNFELLLSDFNKPPKYFT